MLEPHERHVSFDVQEKSSSLSEMSFAGRTDEIQTKAILDCGASESIIGAHIPSNFCMSSTSS